MRLRWISRVVSGTIAAALLSVFGSCSTVADNKPDTGYGSGQTAPATENCADLCQRVADCGVHLCDEDNNTTRYLGSLDALRNLCLGSCTDAQISGNLSQGQWQCIFHDSCRMVLGNNSCGTPFNSYACG